MIEHVRRRAILSNIKDIYIVTNSKIICNLIKSYSGKVLMTKKLHFDGSSRVEEVIRELNYAKILLLQGDEPLIFPSYLNKLSYSNLYDEKTVLNLASKCNSDDLYNKDIVKCVVNKNNVHTLFRYPNHKIINNQNKIFKNLRNYTLSKKFF